MGFDIFLSTCNLGTQKKRVKNPMTGKTMMVPDDLGLNDEERAGVLRLMKQVKAEGPDDFGTWNITFADGGEADFSAERGWRDATIDARVTRNREPLRVRAKLADLSRVGAPGAATDGEVELAFAQTQVTLKGRVPIDHALGQAALHVDLKSPSLADVFAFYALERGQSAPVEAHFDVALLPQLHGDGFQPRDRGRVDVDAWRGAAHGAPGRGAGPGVASKRRA